MEFENELLKNFHYNYARKLNQLRRFRIITLKNGLNQYIEICQKKGQKIGDIKPKIFSNCTIMDFMGKFVS